jgi:hypothetical protein
MSIKNFHHNMLIENLFFKKTLKLVVVRSFCFTLYFPPFGINCQKRNLLRALFTFSSMVQMNVSEDYAKVESGVE